MGVVVYRSTDLDAAADDALHSPTADAPRSPPVAGGDCVDVAAVAARTTQPRRALISVAAAVAVDRVDSMPAPAVPLGFVVVAAVAVSQRCMLWLGLHSQCLDAVTVRLLRWPPTVAAW